MDMIWSRSAATHIQVRYRTDIISTLINDILYRCDRRHLRFKCVWITVFFRLFVDLRQWFVDHSLIDRCALLVGCFDDGLRLEVVLGWYWLSCELCISGLWHALSSLSEDWVDFFNHVLWGVRVCLLGGLWGVEVALGSVDIIRVGFRAHICWVLEEFWTITLDGDLTWESALIAHAF